MKTLFLIVTAFLLTGCAYFSPRVDVNNVERNCARQALASYTQCVDGNILGATPFSSCKQLLRLNLQTCPQR